MGSEKQVLYDALVEEFNNKPGFLLARTLFLFCHFNPGFEMPSDIMQKFIQWLMDDEIRAFSLMYSRAGNGRAEKGKSISGGGFDDSNRDLFDEIVAKNLSAATGKAYSSSMVKNVTRKYKGIESYNEILEMFIVASAQEKRSASPEISAFTGLLKSFPVFSPLNDKELYDLVTFLQFRSYGQDERILRKGDPGTHLYIVLTGKVEVVGENGDSISVLESGSIFGEMSLLTGAPVGTSVYSRGETKLAVMTSIDFKHVLHQYPVLHIFFYRLLTERAGKTSKVLADVINAGMSGDVSEIHVVDLFQMINTSQKTGTVELKLKSGRANVYFRDGELVYADYGKFNGRRAVFALLGATSGQFVYSPGIPPDAKKYEIIGGFMGLVMEGMQRLDEDADLLEEAV